MQWLMEIWRRLGALVRRRALERRLDEEFAFHVDQQIEKLRRGGVSSEEARRQALVRFGGIVSTTERTGDEVRLALLEDSVRDFRHAVRLLARAPGFTIAALLTLAVGIGATSAIFSVVRTVMLEPLPYREPDRIVAVWETNRGGTTRNVIAPSNFVAWRERSRTLDHLGMVGPAFAVSSTVIDGQPVPNLGPRRLVRRLQRPGRAARARPRLHGRRGHRPQRRGDRGLEPRVLARASGGPPGRARPDAHHGRPPART